MADSENEVSTDMPLARARDQQRPPESGAAHHEPEAQKENDAEDGQDAGSEHAGEGAERAGRLFLEV